MDPLTLFQESIKHYAVDLSRVRLFTTASSAKQEAVLLYVGPEQSGRQAVAAFQRWLFPWLGERREDIAGLVIASDVAKACEQVRAFAGPTEVLRVLGSWGHLQWAIALSMVGRLAADTHPYAEAYFDGGADALRAVLGITAHRESYIPNTGGPQRPVTNNLLTRGFSSIADQLRGLLLRLEPEEQLRLLEQVTLGEVETFDFPFEPLTR